MEPSWFLMTALKNNAGYNSQTKWAVNGRYKPTVNSVQAEKYYRDSIVNIFPNFSTTEKQAESNLLQWC